MGAWEIKSLDKADAQVDFRTKGSIGGERADSVGTTGSSIVVVGNNGRHNTITLDPVIFHVRRRGRVVMRGAYGYGYGFSQQTSKPGTASLRRRRRAAVVWLDK